MSFTAAWFTCAAGANEVDRFLEAYGSIKTVSWKIRRSVKTPDGKTRYLSRVYYGHGGRLHVDNITPLKRRIVSDGSRFYSYVRVIQRAIPGPFRSFRATWPCHSRKVPGTAMDHLLRLEGAPEQDIPPAPPFTLRKGYPAGKQFVVLCMDDARRLAGIDFYKTPAMRERTATYRYSKFREVLPGTWIPLLHEGEVTLNGTLCTETVHVDQVEVNTPVAESLFVAAPFFKKVEFVDDFAKMYE